MQIETGHRTFDKQAVDVVLGAALTNTQFSIVIKAPEGREAKLFKDKPEVYEWIRDSIRENGYDKIVYEFGHECPITGQIVSHGFVITDLEHNLIRYFKTGPTLKSGCVINWAIKRIEDKRLHPPAANTDGLFGLST